MVVAQNVCKLLSTRFWSITFVHCWRPVSSTLVIAALYRLKLSPVSGHVTEFGWCVGHLHCEEEFSDPKIWGFSWGVCKVVHNSQACFSLFFKVNSESRYNQKRSAIFVFQVLVDPGAVYFEYSEKFTGEAPCCDLGGCRKSLDYYKVRQKNCSRTTKHPLLSLSHHSSPFISSSVCQSTCLNYSVSALLLSRLSFVVAIRCYVFSVMWLTDLLLWLLSITKLIPYLKSE